MSLTKRPAGDGGPRRPNPDHAVDAIVIILVITVACGHWSAEQVLTLLSLILAILGVRSIAFRRA